MTDEEKEIVDKFEKLYLKDFKGEKITNEYRLSYIECAIISHLIEKQQKEIEEKTTIIMAGTERVKILEKEKQEMLKTITHYVNGEIISDIYAIPKSKIEEKIEEIKNQGNSKYCKYVTYRTRNDFIVEKYGLIDVLQELLESEDK